MLHKLNAATADSPGSPYLQARIDAAKHILLKDLNAKPEAKPEEDCTSPITTFTNT